VDRSDAEAVGDERRSGEGREQREPAVVADAAVSGSQHAIRFHAVVVLEQSTPTEYEQVGFGCSGDHLGYGLPVDGVHTVIAPNVVR
jgi:hypothetical protein